MCFSRDTQGECVQGIGVTLIALAAGDSIKCAQPHINPRLVCISTTMPRMKMTSIVASNKGTWGTDGQTQVVHPRMVSWR